MRDTGSSDIPIPEVFNELGIYERGRFELGYNKDFISWLKGKNLVFTYDGRQSIPFDILSLCYASILNRAPRKSTAYRKSLSRSAERRGIISHSGAWRRPKEQNFGHCFLAN